MSDERKKLTKGEMDRYFSELGRELKKEFGRKAKIELVVVGGASILMNYSFRESTLDIDAVVSSQSSIKDVVNRVGDRLGLPDGWLNPDFQQTESYSPKLIGASRFYRTYSQVLDVRTITAENLIAMKLVAFRPYSHDGSDIIGIIREQEDAGKPVTYESVKRALADLYESRKQLDSTAEAALQDALSGRDLGKLFKEAMEKEAKNKELLTGFEKKHKGVLNESNLQEILSALDEKSAQNRNSQ